MNTHHGGSEPTTRNGPERRPLPAAGPRGQARRAGRDSLLTGLQVVVGVWLLVSPAVLAGPSALVAAKDAVAGVVLLATTLAAALAPSHRSAEGRVCVVLGVLLIVAALSLEFGSGSYAAARQWNEVVVGVLLVCLGSARAR